MVAFLAAGLLLIGGLGPTVARADEGNQAGLVVVAADGQVVTRCISFQEDELSGADLHAVCPFLWNRSDRSR